MHIDRKLRFKLFLGVTKCMPLWTYLLQYTTASLSSHLLSNRTIEFYETFLDKDILFRYTYFFSRSYTPLNLFTLMYYCNSFHRSSSQTTQQNFMKPFQIIRTYYVVVHIDGKLRFNFISRSYAPLNLFASMYYCNSYCNSSETT